MTDNITVGNIELFRIIESEGPLLGPFELFPDATREIIESHRNWMIPRFYDPNSNLLTITIQGFLVKTPSRRILVDTCSGSLKNRKRPFFNQRKWPWLESLLTTGTSTEDIDLVICTHLHVDHVGWNTKLHEGCWVPTFPNAQYLIVDKDFQYWQKLSRDTHLPRTGDYFEDSVLPVINSGQVRLVDEEYVMEDGVWFEPMPGHSPGLVAIHLQSGDDEAILASDVLHHPLQCFYPDWSTNFCADQSMARETRRVFLEKYADTGIRCLPTHFPSPTSVFFERDGDRFRFRFDED